MSSKPSPTKMPRLGLWVSAAAVAGGIFLAGCFESKGNGGISRAALIDTGEAVFQTCASCHGEDGRGVAETFPPLANSNFIMAPGQRLRPVRIILEGLTGPITVNGMVYDNEMPAHHDVLSDVQVAGVLTYIRGVLNDSLVVSCAEYDPLDESTYDNQGFAICEKTPRTQAAMDAEYVSVAEVKAVRDSLAAAGAFEP